MLSQYVDVPYAILITAIIFGFCHFITVTYVILATLISIYLSWLLVWSDNLLVPMAAHGVYDLIALIVVMWPRKGERDGGLGGGARGPFEQGGSEGRRGGAEVRVEGGGRGGGGGRRGGEAGGGLRGGEAGGGNREARSAWRT